MEIKTPVSFEDTSVAFSSKTDQQLRQSYRLFGLMNYPWLVNLGTKFIKLALLLKLPVKSLIKATIFKQFCGGEDINDCRPTSLALADYGIGTILDYSVEGTELEDDFEAHTIEMLETIEKSQMEPANPFCVFKVSGIASNVLLELVSADQPLNADQKQAWQRVLDRMEKICAAAHKHGVSIMIDAEESWIQDAIDQAVYDLMKRYNQDRPLVFNTYQMYRHDMLQKLKDAFHQAATHNYYLGVKLVRGAYMEKERERAEEMGYASPIQPNKKATDDDFNHALKFCVDNLQRIALCCGSHNEYSNYFLTVLMDKYSVKVNDPRIYFVQLYGMSDNISYNLAHAGYNVAKYLPYGPIHQVMPYLFRRADENTAIAGQTNQEYRLIKSEIKRRRLAKA